MTAPRTDSLARDTEGAPGDSSGQAAATLRGKGFLLAFVFAATVLGAGIVSGYSEQSRLTSEIKYLKMRIEKVTMENENLRKEIDSLENDPYYVERIVRKELKRARSREYWLKDEPVQTPRGRGRED